MRVGIITELMDERPAGMGSYVHSLVEHLLREDKGTEYVLIHGRSGGHELYRQAEEVSVGAEGPLGRGRRKLFGYPRAMRKARLDVVHYPDYLGPFLRRAPCASVETIHDLVPFVMPGTHKWDVNFTFRRVFPRFIVPHVDHFIAVSNNTAKDLQRYTPLGKERITVIWEAANPIFRPVGGKHLRDVLKRHGLRPGYILSVGTLEPRKNLSRLMEAYSMLRRRGLKRPLVLAGKRGWKYDDIFRKREDLSLGDHVRHVDYVPFDDLPAIYSGASVMVYPSLYEGFGLPPLEAMACGCPVIASNTSSLPEVVGDAGLLLDPRDVEGMARAMEDVLKDKDRRDEMKAAGFDRARRFSWSKTARRTARLYKKLAKKD